MNEKLTNQIIAYNKAWISSQKLYIKIDGIPVTRHCSYPEPLQRIIVKETFTEFEINEDKAIDFTYNNTELAEMKSTTKEDGVVKLTETQANDSNYLIWFFADADSEKISIKILKIDKNNRTDVLNYVGTTKKISTLFDGLHGTIVNSKVYDMNIMK